jgi:NAD(P)-dependent dehydrogenase (short-subunit alcohol dehydrogenase family)
MIDLKDQVAIVTGGGSGIGRAVALALGAAGARVAICGRRAGPLEHVVNNIKALGGQGLAISADVTRIEEVEQLVNVTVETWGGVDILVNNAGINGGSPIHEQDIEEWDQVMAVNLRGPFLLARATLPLMRRQRRGHIINISSESGLEYYAGHGAYGVAKHALNALGEFIQRENQECGIQVNTICPGMVVTEMTENTPGLDLDRCLRPEDIADLVLWLLTRHANVKFGRPILIQTMENPWQ